jgi:long-chain acyl-CoA synthetase
VSGSPVEASGDRRHESDEYLEAVREQARARPDAVAFELARGERSTVLTYGGLIERVQRLGAALRAAGYGEGNRVAICMENRPAWPVAFLAGWYAGAVTVPLDPALDETILGRLLAHSGARVCVTSPQLLAKIERACATLDEPPVLLTPDGPTGGDDIGYWDGEPPGGGSSAGPAIRSLSDLVAGEAGVGEEWNPRRSGPDELGSIMYTSGTTGAPKGVMIRRDAVLENLRAGIKRVRLTEEDRLLGILPLFHVLPLITNCLGPLYLGARVVFLSELTAERIMAAFGRHRITVFVCVPAFFYRFHDRLTGTLQQAPPLQRRIAGALLGLCRRVRRATGYRLGRLLLAKAHRPFGEDMRLFITGGAKMNAEVFDDFLDWGFTLAQGYGLTEATAILTATPLDELRGDTVGRPVAGVELRIHEPDEEGIGEIWARGPSLMEGYYRDPEATAAALQDGWLRTGDLGRLLDNGHLQITGRAKDVIVLASGKNIYPDELEGYYGQSELVDEICVLGIADEAGRGERLHAVVVPHLEAARERGYVNVREMIKWELESMGAELPGPQRLTSLEIRNEPLPRTPTRKIKRFELRDEITRRRSEGGDRRSAGDEAETAKAADDGTAEPDWAGQVRVIVARHAKTDKVSRGDHLDIDLGLESLDRMELLAELEQALNVRLGEATAGEVHSVGELIDAIGARLQDGGATAAGTGEVARGAVAEGGGAGGPMAAERGDRWARILAKAPDGIDVHLRRRWLTDSLIWLALRKWRVLWSLVAGYRVDGVERLPDEYPFMICANHASYADPTFLCMALPHRVLGRVFFVGYSEYFEGPLGRQFGKLVRNIPIDPNRNLERAMQAAAEGLRRGMVLVIFPEGGRSLDGSVREFRRGAAILARHLDVPLVPAGIWGAHEVWPRGGKFRRHPVSVAFGEPIAPTDHDDEAELTEALQARVVAAVETARQT